jgi:peroxiredoxin
VFRPLKIAAFGSAALALALAACSNEHTAADAASAAHENHAPPAAAAPAAAPAEAQVTLANFTLPDANGKTHELYALKDKPAIVIVMQGVGCPIVQQMTPDLKAVEAAYKPKGVQFFMLNANIQDKSDAIAAEAKNFENDIPILKDESQQVAMKMGAVRTAETFIIDPKTWKVVFHGPLNDRLTYGRAKAKADNNYASNVLDAMLAGQPVPEIHQQADGCIINFPKDHA